MTRHILSRAERDDVCSVCGHGPANDYGLPKSSNTIMLCGDCLLFASSCRRRRMYQSSNTFPRRPYGLSVTPPAGKTCSGCGHIATAFLEEPAILAGVIFIAGAALAAYLWFGHDSHCGGSIAITSPAEGTEVRQKEVIRGTREPKEWFCRCKDYVVVEVGQWYVQGRLLEATQWSVTADFGDYDTRPGTRFSVFVLSTTADLSRGALVQSPALIATAKKSPVVGVIAQSSLNDATASPGGERPVPAPLDFPSSFPDTSSNRRDGNALKR